MRDDYLFIEGPFIFEMLVLKTIAKVIRRAKARLFGGKAARSAAKDSQPTLAEEA